MFVLGVVALARECLHVDTSTFDVRLRTQHVGIYPHMDIPEFRPVIFCYDECQLRWAQQQGWRPTPKWRAQPIPAWPQQQGWRPVRDEHHVINLGDGIAPAEHAAAPTTIDTVVPMFTSILGTVLSTMAQSNQQIMEVIGRQQDAAGVLATANLNNVVQQMHRNNMEQHQSTMNMMERLVTSRSSPAPATPSPAAAVPDPRAGPPGGMPAPPPGNPAASPPPPPSGQGFFPSFPWRQGPRDPKDFFCGLHM